jgi:hypothetical protein
MSSDAFELFRERRNQRPLTVELAAIMDWLVPRLRLMEFLFLGLLLSLELLLKLIGLFDPSSVRTSFGVPMIGLLPESGTPRGAGR